MNKATGLLPALLLAAFSLLPFTTALADDVDIYIDPTPLPAQAPLTALALDLNLTGAGTVACNNVLLSNEASCVSIRGKVSVGDLLTFLGAPITIVPGLDPAALLQDLSSGVATILSTALNALGNPAALVFDGPATYLLAIQQILTSLTDSRVTILLNHANRGPRDLGGLTTACGFADASSLPGQRQDTLACSNGAYLFTGLVDLANPLQLLALLDRIRGALLGDLVTATVNPIDGGVIVTAGVTPGIPPIPRALAPNHAYQTKEIYAELAKYLRGDAVFNGHLGVFDYGDENAANNLDASFPLLSWDATVETPDHRSYQSGLAAYPFACNINLVHVQSSNALGQDDSDAALKTLFPGSDEDGNGTLTLPELVKAAEGTGFVFGTDDRRRITSRFVVQENLFVAGDLSDLDRINSLGGNVSSYTDIIGLLGRGKNIAGSLIKPLSVNASLTGLGIAASRSSATGILPAAYMPLFRADPEQRPAWPGNVKRLTLRAKPAPNQKRFDVVDARDDANSPAVSALGSDGKIRSTALSLWTDATKLGTGVSNDGGVADLGGAGQRIPGYQFGGGGNPGRGNATGTRQIYYDSKLATGNVLCADLASCAALNPDDAGVRTELLAATGASDVTLPDPNCSANCQADKTARDDACNAPGAFTAVCDAENSACLANCSATDNTNICNTEQASCITNCNADFPGIGNTLLRTACITGCNTTRVTCPATKLLQCNALCPIALATCPLTKQLQCLADSLTLNTSCLLACQTTRTADTVTRELLLHARGFDVGTRASPKGTGPASSPTNTGVTGRPWMLGAVLHSKPLAINYGRVNGANNPEVVRVVYGSADGMLHMIDDTTGAELWGFMPQAVMGSLATLRDNQTGATLPYGVDGSPIVILRDRTGSSLTSAGDGIISASSSEHDRALVIFGLRRGGAAYYALDVTDPNSPKLAWRLTTEGLLRAGEGMVDPGSAAQFASLALAFSTPQVARIRLDADGVLTSPSNTDVENRTVLIFGGGYNGGRNGAGSKVGKDLNNSRAVTPVSNVGTDDGSGATDRGNALFMVDAATGQLIWRAVRSSVAAASYTAASKTYAHPLMVDSIASDVTALDTDNDSYTDRVYVGDTGGRLWRADFVSAYPENWTVTPIASVGRHNPSGSTLANDRRIFFAPDYVPTRSLTGGGLDLVLFGTGDREDVLNLSTQNWFYALKDPDLYPGKTSGEIILSEDDLPRHSGFTDVSSNTTQDISALSNGYRFQFTRTGEKLFSTPVTLGGTATFTSYVPPDPSIAGARVCTPSEGVSRLFSIGVRKSEFRSINDLSSAGRDIPLATGLPTEITVLSDTNQTASGQLFNVPARDTYRASWRERIGETEK